MEKLFKMLFLALLAFTLIGCSSDSEEEQETIRLDSPVVDGSGNPIPGNNGNIGGSITCTRSQTELLSIINANSSWHQDISGNPYVKAVHSNITTSSNNTCNIFGIDFFCAGQTAEVSQVYQKVNGVEVFGEPQSDGSVNNARFSSTEAIKNYIYSYIYFRRQDILNINCNIPLQADYRANLVALATGSPQTGANANVSPRIYMIDFRDGTQIAFSFNIPLWANPIYVKTYGIVSVNDFPQIQWQEYRLTNILTQPE